MTAPAPWSVKGIDPKAREVAKELARREGLTLGEWLNRMIVEQEGERPAAEPIPLEPSVRGLLGRLERGEREQIAVAARFEGLAEELRHDQMRLAERLRRMEQSGEGYGSSDAIRSLEQTVSRLAGHVYDGEGRVHDAIRDLGVCFLKLDDRLQ
ncbi:MAG TPA: Localization factor PodJS, partial [Caulobacteraceae bacterium]|nr:Localization factor PodJS [Caulobacteraceae bacterium]